MGENYLSGRRVAAYREKSDGVVRRHNQTERFDCAECPNGAPKFEIEGQRDSAVQFDQMILDNLRKAGVQNTVKNERATLKLRTQN